MFAPFDFGLSKTKEIFNGSSARSRPENMPSNVGATGRRAVGLRIGVTFAFSACENRMDSSQARVGVCVKNGNFSRTSMLNLAAMSRFAGKSI